MTDTHHCETVVRQYVEAMSAGLEIEPHGDGCIVMTPFMRPDGDFVELMVAHGEDGALRLTDMGESVAFLHLSGLSLSRQIMGDIRRIASRYGVSLAQNELVVEDQVAPDLNPVHALIQAMMGVSGLVEKRRLNARIRFAETVEVDIIAQRLAYDVAFQVQGKRKRHTIGLHIDGKSRFLIQPLSHRNENAAKSTAEKWFHKFSDILDGDNSWQCYVLLDDRGSRKAWTADARRPLGNLVNVVPWSEKEVFLHAIAPGGNGPIARPPQPRLRSLPE